MRKDAGLESFTCDCDHWDRFFNWTGRLFPKIRSCPRRPPPLSPLEHCGFIRPESLLPVAGVK